MPHIHLIRAPPPLTDSRKLLKEGNALHLIREAIDGDDITAPILVHRWTLFLTIYISILQGSLLSYTCGCTLFGMALPPLLYFVRIFADLLGRPLALLPKPSVFTSIRGVFYGSLIRCIASFYFFYVVHTISPHASLLKDTLGQSLGLTLFQVSLCWCCCVLSASADSVLEYSIPDRPGSPCSPGISIV